MNKRYCALDTIEVDFCARGKVCPAAPLKIVGKSNRRVGGTPGM